MLSSGRTPEQGFGYQLGIHTFSFSLTALSNQIEPIAPVTLRALTAFAETIPKEKQPEWQIRLPDTGPNAESEARDAAASSRTTRLHSDYRNCKGSRLGSEPEPLIQNVESGSRKGLTFNILDEALGIEALENEFALHAMAIAAEYADVTAFRAYVREQFQGPAAFHRMAEGRKTDFNPLQTTGYDEAQTGDNGRVMDNIHIRQLDGERLEIVNLLNIAGGDQSSVEKMRKLKELLDSCPHGYARYGWVLPLIQL